MDTNYEAIRSLIEILVKKAGYDINSSYSENELSKTKETINKLEQDSELENTIKDELLANLKIRRANWENNAEVIGKSLLNCYKEKKSFSEVRGKIEYLSKIAKNEEEKNSQSLMSYIYNRIKQLDEHLKELKIKIEENNYINNEEKELDIRIKEYLINAVDRENNKITLIDKELERIKDEQHKEQAIKDKLNNYVTNVKKDIEILDKLKRSSLNKGITLEIWEKIENIELNIKEKLEKVLKLIKHNEEVLKELESNKLKCENKKTMLANSIEKNNKKLEQITDKINENDYVDYASKINDINQKELINIELNELNNKKDVIYVNVDKVKEELIKEWTKDKNNSIQTDNISASENNENYNELGKKEEVIEKVEENKLEINKQEKKEITTKSNKIELDW